ncbi:dockerin type I domain-containing protein [Pseudobacteroides cellulosolvens]
MADVIIIAGFFNQLSSQSNIKCDLNSDGVINMSDIIILAKKFNKIF